MISVNFSSFYLLGSPGIFSLLNDFRRIEIPFFLGIGGFIQYGVTNRLGQVENARRHISFPGLLQDPAELKKLQIVEKHLNKCTDARRIGDWKSVLREGDAVIAAGADHCPQVRPNNF